MPNYKRVLRHRVGRREYVEHGACILVVSQTQLFLAFQDAHLEITFEACKPWFVRYMREWDTCCCGHHVHFLVIVLCVLPVGKA